MHLYLGIDFGTTGVRTSVINEKKEELINYSVSIESPISKGSLDTKIQICGGKLY